MSEAHGRVHRLGRIPGVGNDDDSVRAMPAAVDHAAVDQGGAEPAVAGDEVLLFGPGDAGEPTAQDWADALGTISYEIATRFGGRMPRSYLGVT